MTKLEKPISRETAKLIGKLPVVITIAPCGSQSEARIGLRLKGRRTQYVVALSDLFRIAAIRQTAGEYHTAHRVIILTDKPQKPLPASVWESLADQQLAKASKASERAAQYEALEKKRIEAGAVSANAVTGELNFA